MALVPALPPNCTADLYLQLGDLTHDVSAVIAMTVAVGGGLACTRIESRAVAGSPAGR